ncbi:MAG: hypothetical protein AAFX56_20450 [Pseudomonadota bacterium]
MDDETENYAHLVEVDAEKKQLVIYRLSASGSKRLFTSIDLPSETFSENKDGFREFATRLGENLLVDSPVARDVLGL